jgi:CheY-like chemotaxis protein
VLPKDYQHLADRVQLFMQVETQFKSLVSRDAFAHHVKDALGNFYDTIHLQTHPLSEMLALHRRSGETTAEALRLLLRETIEGLRPPAPVPMDRAEWLSFRLLWLHYVQSCSQSEVCQELALSQASFYRRLQEALEAVASVLWDRYQQEHSTVEGGQAGATTEAYAADRALDQAIQLAYVAIRRPVDMSKCLQSVSSTIAPFLHNQGVALRIEAPPALPLAYGDPVVLEQILLNILTEAIGLAGSDGLTLVVRVRGGDTVWELRGLAVAKGSPPEVPLSRGLVIARGMLAAYGGQLGLDRDEGANQVIHFTLPMARLRRVLIIDDDSDAVMLYRRYLSGHGYGLHSTQDPDQVSFLVAESRPEVVLLDVLMPQRDGWRVLQRLKATPETASIPVIVCSVLSQPGLALALGAAQVLQKPISQEALVRAVQEALNQVDSER